MAARRKKTGGRVEVTSREAVTDRTREAGTVVADKKPYTPPAVTPIVPKVHQFCPTCKSTRHRLIRTEPGDDGRMEIRLCLGCGNKFKTWDPRWRK